MVVHSMESRLNDRGVTQIRFEKGWVMETGWTGATMLEACAGDGSSTNSGPAGPAPIEPNVPIRQQLQPAVEPAFQPASPSRKDTAPAQARSPLKIHSRDSPDRSRSHGDKDVSDDIQLRIERISAQLNDTSSSSRQQKIFAPEKTPAAQPRVGHGVDSAAAFEQPLAAKSPPRITYSSAEAGGLLDFFANATIEQIFDRYGQLSRSPASRTSPLAKPVACAQESEARVDDTVAQKHDKAVAKAQAETEASAKLLAEATARTARQLAEAEASAAAEVKALAKVQAQTHALAMQQMRGEVECLAIAEAERAAVALNALPQEAADIVMHEFRLAVDSAINAVAQTKSGAAVAAAVPNMAWTPVGVNLLPRQATAASTTAAATTIGTPQHDPNEIAPGHTGSHSAEWLSDSRTGISQTLSKIEFDHAVIDNTCSVDALQNSGIALKNMVEFNDRLADQVRGMNQQKQLQTSRRASPNSQRDSRSRSPDNRSHSKSSRSSTADGSNRSSPQVSWADASRPTVSLESNAAQSPSLSLRTLPPPLSPLAVPLRSNQSASPPHQQHQLNQDSTTPPLPSSVWTFHPDTDTSQSSAPLDMITITASTPKEFVLAKANVYIAKRLGLARPRHQEVDDGQIDEAMRRAATRGLVSAAQVRRVRRLRDERKLYVAFNLLQLGNFDRRQTSREALQDIRRHEALASCRQQGPKEAGPGSYMHDGARDRTVSQPMERPFQSEVSGRRAERRPEPSAERSVSVAERPRAQRMAEEMHNVAAAKQSAGASDNRCQRRKNQKAFLERMEQDAREREEKLHELHAAKRSGSTQKVISTADHASMLDRMDEFNRQKESHLAHLREHPELVDPECVFQPETNHALPDSLSESALLKANRGPRLARQHSHNGGQHGGQVARQDDRTTAVSTAPDLAQAPTEATMLAMVGGMDPEQVRAIELCARWAAQHSALERRDFELRLCQRTDLPASTSPPGPGHFDFLNHESSVEWQYYQAKLHELENEAGAIGPPSPQGPAQAAVAGAATNGAANGAAAAHRPRWEVNVIQQLCSAMAGARYLYGVHIRTPADFFAAVDRDSSGAVDKVEFKTALERLDVSLTAEQLEKLFDGTDQSAAGRQELSYHELLAELSGVDQSIGVDQSVATGPSIKSRPEQTRGHSVLEPQFWNSASSADTLGVDASTSAIQEAAGPEAGSNADQVPEKCEANQDATSTKGARRTSSVFKKRRAATGRRAEQAIAHRSDAPLAAADAARAGVLSDAVRVLSDARSQIDLAGVWRAVGHDGTANATETFALQHDSSGRFDYIGCEGPGDGHEAFTIVEGRLELDQLDHGRPQGCEATDQGVPTKQAVLRFVCEQRYAGAGGSTAAEHTVRWSARLQRGVAGVSSGSSEPWAMVDGEWAGSFNGTFSAEKIAGIE